MVSIEWTKDADFDLNAILTYLSKSSPQYAFSLLENVDEALVNLNRFPKIGRKVPESDNVNDREIILKPYRLIYRYIEDQNKIYVIMLIHGSRQLTALEQLNGIAGSDELDFETKIRENRKDLEQFFKKRLDISDVD